MLQRVKGSCPWQRSSHSKLQRVNLKHRVSGWDQVSPSFKELKPPVPGKRSNHSKLQRVNASCPLQRWAPSPGGYNIMRTVEIHQIQTFEKVLLDCIIGVSPMPWLLISVLIHCAHIDGLMREIRNSIANALELRLSCTNPSIYLESGSYHLRACELCSSLWLWHRWLVLQNPV